MMRSRVRFASIVLLIVSLAAFAADDQGTIFIVRHAEKASSASDALLSAAGHKRANCLAQMLKDANIRTIFTPEVKRTQQTAEPLANARHISISVIPRENQSELVKKARGAAQSGDVLIVAQQDTMSQIVQQLGETTSPVGDNEFDRLIVLHLNPSSSSVTTLRYCDCGVPASAASQGMDQGMTPAAATASPH